MSQVAHLLQKIGARCWDPNENEVERMMRIAANWDPETIGRAELIEMAKHKGEGSDSPEEVNVQCRISTERYVDAFGLVGCVHSFFTIVRMVDDACTRLRTIVIIRTIV